jgi:hypothetical protein
MLGQLPKRPSGAGYEQSCLHFEVKHSTQTWAVAYCSFAGRASAGMFVYAESEIVRFWRSQKVTAFRNCLVLAFEQTPRDLPRLASGRAGKDVRKTKNPPAASRVVQVWDSEAHSLHTRISAVNPNSTSLSPALQSLSHSRGPCILSFGGPSESDRREKRTMDIVLQKPKRQGSRL